MEIYQVIPRDEHSKVELFVLCATTQQAYDLGVIILRNTSLEVQHVEELCEEAEQYAHEIFDHYAAIAPCYLNASAVNYETGNQNMHEMMRYNVVRHQTRQEKIAD